MKDLFSVAGFFAVKGRFAEILQNFSLGEAGALIPYTIFEEDETTPFETVYLINFGGPKNSFLKEASRDVKLRYMHRETGIPSWEVHAGNSGYDGTDELALSPAAMEGADLWVEATVWDRVFMSNALAEAVRAAKLKQDFQLTRCRVV